MSGSLHNDLEKKIEDKTNRPCDLRSESVTPILASQGSICNSEDVKKIRN